MSSSYKLYRESALNNILSIREGASSYFSQHIDNVGGNFGIDGNTFRAYRNYPIFPSLVYKNWIDENDILKNYAERFNLLNSLSSFKSIHSELCADLTEYWIKCQKEGLTISQKFKIIDLFVKFNSRIKVNGYDQLNNNLCKYGNIPLDSYSLRAISLNFYGIVISQRPGMGDIKDELTYNFLQDQINELMIDLQLPNLYFDYYAWNAPHIQ